MNFMKILKLIYVKSIISFRKLIIKLFQVILFKNNNNPKKILIHRVAAFGDTIVSLPAISMVRKNFPNSRIDILSTNCVGIDISNIIKDNSYIDNIYTFKKGEIKDALKMVKKTKYDLYIEIPQNLNLYKSIRNMFRVKFIFCIDSAFGWDEGRVKKFLDVQKKYLEPKREVDRFLDILEENGLKKENKIDFMIKPDSSKVERCLEKNEKKNLGFLIGGKLSSKKWPLAYWAELAKLTVKDFNIYLLGGNDESLDAQKIVDLSKSNIINLCGKFDILDSANFLSRMDLVVSQDTGAMHLAYAVNTPVIALMSTRDLTNKWFPYGNNNIILENVLACSFCLKKECEDNLCMKNISVSEVNENIKKILNKEIF